MEKFKLAVNGTLMCGLELNCNLLAAGAEFICETTTAAIYRLWTINDAYPAMLRDEQSGSSISVEVWALEAEGLIAVLQREPPACASAVLNWRTVRSSLACSPNRISFPVMRRSRAGAAGGSTSREKHKTR